MAFPVLVAVTTPPEDVRNMILSLPRKFQKRAFRKIITAGVKPEKAAITQILKNEARTWSEGQNEFGEKRKKLHTSITVRLRPLKDRGDSKGAYFGIVGHIYSRENYAHSHLVNFGTRPHSIVAGTNRRHRGAGGSGKRLLVGPTRANRKRPRKILKSRNNVYGTATRHSGAKALRHIERVFRSGEASRTTRMQARARTAIPEELKQTAKDRVRSMVRKHIGKLPPGMKLQTSIMLKPTSP